MDFGDDLEVVAVRSSEGEVIGLTQIISTAKARGQVEKWLVQLEASVKCSIKKVSHARIMSSVLGGELVGDAIIMGLALRDSGRDALLIFILQPINLYIFLSIACIGCGVFK